MIFYSLRPVGEPVVCKRSSRNLADSFKPCQAAFFDSGTAALAAAIGAAIKLKHPRQQEAQAEIILPAYACPALVSAILYNGAKPILVDLAPDQISLNITAVKTQLNRNTAALISVDLFGLPSVSQQLRDLLEEHGCTLIHDCAQAVPTEDQLAAVKDELVIVSFGRGKPVSILNGGAVLYATGQSWELPAVKALKPVDWGAKLKISLKFFLYNLIISPRIYWITRYLPITLGETRYKPLAGIGSISSAAAPYLPANLDYAKSKPQWRRTEYAKLAKTLTGQGWTDLCAIADPQHQHSLLRYVLLAPSQRVRDSLLANKDLQQYGLTALYGKPITEIDDIPPALQQPSHFINAESFAARLITLPLHSGLKNNVIAEADIISALAKREFADEPP
jgi:dTDP-4-amino-4,6-dideoxygalactose transaminase